MSFGRTSVVWPPGCSGSGAWLSHRAPPPASFSACAARLGWLLILPVISILAYISIFNPHLTPAMPPCFLDAHTTVRIPVPFYPAARRIPSRTYISGAPGQAGGRQASGCRSLWPWRNCEGSDGPFCCCSAYSYAEARGSTQRLPPLRSSSPPKSPTHDR
ncbi:hypothetical protein B0H13DRAFT_2302362 [Mycena leptocephala]|nr:hypothetical protein B0H13DRAFT_2302362 [Mycena leptocephala]